MTRGSSPEEKRHIAKVTAQAIADEDAEACKRIGEHGKTLLEALAAKKANGAPVNILTHCNAGWLAFVDYGSALSPVYAAHNADFPCMCGSTKPVPGTKVQASRRGSSPGTACPTR